MSDKNTILSRLIHATHAQLGLFPSQETPSLSILLYFSSAARPSTPKPRRFLFYYICPVHNLIKRGDWLGWEAETALHSLFADEFAQMRTDAQGNFLLLQVLYVSQDYELVVAHGRLLI